MRLTINGEVRDVASGTIPELLGELALPAAVTLVEHNGVALRRDEWMGHILREGDRLELIRVVAGG